MYTKRIKVEDLGRLALEGGQHQQQQLVGNLIQVLPVGSRKVRDSWPLLAMFAFIGFLAYIIWDGIVVREVDVNLIMHGHDSYGNICGRNNRPIRFAEKSGKNYTNKPFTKYTLINAQFERYTLDTNRLRNGELLYVKQPESSSLTPQKQQDDSLSPSTSYEMVDLEKEQDELEKMARGAARTLPRKQISSQGRMRRALGTLELDSFRRNQTLLTRLKSSLMYQYPPMYGYTGTASRPQQATATIADAQPAAIQSLMRPGSGPANTMSVERPKYALAAPSSSPASTGGAHSAEVANTGPTSHGLAVGLATSPASSRPMTAHGRKSEGAELMAAASSSSSFMHTNWSPSARPPLEAIVGATRAPEGPSSTELVTFDDRAGDADHYGHTLVGAGRPMLTGNHSAGLTPSEVTGHLLYLTECVEICPREHIELILHRCVPRNWRFSLFPNAINVTRTFIDDILTDMGHCYRELIYTFSLAVVLSLALLVLLRFLASLIIWSCLALLVGLLLSMAGYSWFTYYNLIIELSNSGPTLASVQSERWASADKWLLGSVMTTTVAFGSIAVLVFMRRRILLVTLLFKESGKAIGDMPLLLLQPVLTFGALIGLAAIWALGMICLQSMKTPVIDTVTGFVLYRAETLHKLMKWYHIFAFLWVAHFAIACQHYVIGAAVSKWYFSANRYNLHSPIGSSVSELFLYYMGSVALGSFLVAVFKVVRLVTRQIQFLLQRNCLRGPTASASVAPSDGMPGMGPPGLSSSAGSSCCGSMSYVWRTLLWLFDNIVMIISRDAYVEIAIHGQSFLASAKRAFTIVASNPLRLIAIKSVSNVLLTVAKVCVVFGTVSVALILVDEKRQRLNYSWSPIVVATMYAYVVAHWFISVYEMVIDALFICYCEDYERSKKQEESAQLAESRFMAQILSDAQMQAKTTEFSSNNNNNTGSNP